MNTKIYFNNKFLEFTEEQLQDSQNQPIIFYDEISEEKLNIILKDILNESFSAVNENIIGFKMPVKNFQAVINYLKKNLHYIEAAGGLIKKEHQFLFIYRLSRWDLPKGKLEKGETIEAAAIRECEEECGIKKLKIEQQLSSTYHVYKYKGKFALKQTYWFFMTSTYNKALKPQTEENIEQVKWFTKDEINDTVFSNSYFTIKDVVNEAFIDRKI